MAYGVFPRLAPLTCFSPRVLFDTGYLFPAFKLTLATCFPRLATVSCFAAFATGSNSDWFITQRD